MRHKYINIYCIITQIQYMEIYTIIMFIPYDTVFAEYTYVENLICSYGTLEEAQIEANKMIDDAANDGYKYDGEEYHNFLRIIKMTLGHKKQEIVFDSRSTELENDAPIYTEL